MPNRPKNPYSRMPVKVIAGLLFISLAGLVYLLKDFTRGDVPVFVAGGLSFLIAAALILKLKEAFPGSRPGAWQWPSFRIVSEKKEPPAPAGAQKAGGAAFDIAAFIDPDTRRLIAQEKKMETLRDHPETPTNERKTAARALETQVKKRVQKQRRKPI